MIDLESELDQSIGLPAAHFNSRAHVSGSNSTPMQMQMLNQSNDQAMKTDMQRQK